MTAMATAPLSHQRSRRAIDAHFAGHAVPELEAAMRAHTLQCEACRSYYDRHLLLARFDPTAPPAAARIARGLGLRLDTRPRMARAVWWAAALAVPAAAALLLVARSDRVVAPLPGADATPDMFAARAVSRADALQPGLWIYRLGADGRPRLAKGEVDAGDELAFAYANPAGKPYVLVFGVDEHRHVYWFHPAWSRGQPSPSAVPAAPGAGPHELPEAIRSGLDGRRLIVHALFADRPLRASDVEARVQSEGGWETPSPDSGAHDGIQMVVRELQVLR
jgi:hypothetical protein